ncbi:unnamed protein product [Ectocarpus fasciculatus]
MASSHTTTSEMTSPPKSTRERDREKGSVPPLPLSRVKALAQNDESIGKMSVQATCMIARCTDAFLVDLVKASVDRAKAAGHREPNKKVRKCPDASKSVPQQVLPEDVRQAVAEEERFDFLRPVLSPAQESSGSLSAAGTKRTRKGGATSARAGAKTAGGAKKGKARRDLESAGGAASRMDGESDLIAPGGAIASTAGAGSNLLALAGLDEEGRRQALLGGMVTTATPAACGILGDDDDEDYDNY